MSQASPYLEEGILVNERYRITRLIGKGGFGAVYKAVDERLGNSVALKQTLMEGEALAHAFAHEARLLAGLRHPALPVVSDYFSDISGSFLVMQYIPGDDLSVALGRREGPFPFALVADWADQILDALDYLHSQESPILHRDIKPQNLKLTPRGEVVLLDFGLAKGAAPVAGHEHPVTLVRGYTPNYAPSEQVNEEGTTPRSDLYAFAVTIYQLLTRVLPPRSNTRALAVATGGRDDLAMLHTLNPQVPLAFSEAIHQALALHPNDRPRSAAALRELLHDTRRTTILMTQEAAPAPAAAAAAQAEQPAPSSRAILYDVDERRRNFLNMLDHFGEATRADWVRDLLGREAIARLRYQERQARERIEAPFNLVVLGDFKRGKSTLVNALLGQAVVTSNVTPETLTINRISYGPELTLHAHLADGGRVRLSLDELQAERLEALMRLLPHPVSYLSLTAPVEWLRDIMLVDMPGTGDLEWRFDQHVQSYLPQADAIIYVVSALAPLSASEQAFLRLAIAPQEFPKLTFAANMIDAIRNERDVERVLALLQTRVEAIFPSAALFGISALDELSRQTSQHRPNQRRAAQLERAFAAFRKHLDDAVLLNRHTIQIDRSVAQLQTLIVSFEAAILRLQTAVERDQAQLEQAIVECVDQSSELHRSIARHRQEARATIDELGQQARLWMDEFLVRFEREVIRTLGQQRLSDVQRHFHFFFSDVLALALNRCLEAHQPLIVGIAERARTAIRSDVAGHTTPVPQMEALVASATFAQGSWNGLDTMHWMAATIQSSIFGFVGRLVAHGIMMGLDRQVDDPRQLATYQQQLSGVMPELHSAVAREIDTLYATIAARVDTQIEQAYHDDIALTVATLRQAQEIHARGVQHVAQVKARCMEALELVADTRARIALFERSLWPDDLSMEAA